MSASISDQERLAGYVETWHRACADLVAVARGIPQAQWHLSTDLPGWDVKDNVAHTAHLEAVLAGAPEESVLIDDMAHVKSLTGRYTEQGVFVRRDRSMIELVDEIEQAVATRYAELRANPPTDGSAPAPLTPAGVPWDTETLLANRPLDVWMHEQDIRRAIGRPGGYDSPAAAHTIRRLGAGLPMVLGKRVAPPAGTSVLVEVPEADYRVGAEVAPDGRAALADPVDPTVRITLAPEAFVVLAGGRRRPEDVESRIEGDPDLGHAILASMAVTP